MHGPPRPLHGVRHHIDFISNIAFYFVMLYLYHYIHGLYVKFSDELRIKFHFYNKQLTICQHRTYLSSRLELFLPFSNIFLSEMREYVLTKGSLRVTWYYVHVFVFEVDRKPMNVLWVLPAGFI